MCIYMNMQYRKKVKTEVHGLQKDSDYNCIFKNG